MATDTSDQTPLMKQYWELKSQVQDALLLFRMGDFYELFGDDAVTASKILEITLTSRDKNKPNPMPMAGVPHHSVGGYIQRLLKAGRKIAIGEQVGEVPPAGKGIVRREITRVLSPAVHFDHESADAAFLATAWPMGNLWVAGCLDVSTGELRTSEPLELADLHSKLSLLPIKHWLGHARMPVELKSPEWIPSNGLIEEIPSNWITEKQASEFLAHQYQHASVTTFFPTLEHQMVAATLVKYACHSQRLDRLGHLKTPKALIRKTGMTLGPRTPAHLDLFGGTGPELFAWLNQCGTSMGSRALKRALMEPLAHVTEIKSRQESVQWLGETPQRLESLRLALREIYDLDRLLGRIHSGLAHPRDIWALGHSGHSVEALSTTLKQSASSMPKSLADLNQTISSLQSTLQPLLSEIKRALAEPAPLTARDGGIFAKGFDSELDRLIDLHENGERWLVDLEARERETTGIPSLKVRYNRVFGYYIEVTQAHLKNVPAHYQRKQTTVGAERFFTEELKRFEDEIVSAESKRKKLEQELFLQLIERIKSQASALSELSESLGTSDFLCSLACLMTRPGFVFPVIDQSRDLELVDSRHPIVDESLAGRFVPNTIRLKKPVNLITGPNMGGKSTVMRQAAVIVILGQIGAPVPAKQARWGVVESLFTRIGAHDAIASGQSTFMVEMSELAYLLHHANERSLLILDEIGRGTSTFDGMSVAWGTLEWICGKIKARTFFATHYHELTRLEAGSDAIANFHMAVENPGTKSKSALRFLYELREGATGDSFGIQVAEMAGLPKPLIKRAWQVLERLESTSAEQQSENQKSINQLSLDFSALSAETPEPTPEPSPIESELEGLDLNQITPIQALNFLVEAKRKLQDRA